jgi:hypothetical protein
MVRSLVRIVLMLLALAGTHLVSAGTQVIPMQ